MFFQNLLSVLFELSPWLLLGSVVAGMLHVLLPSGFIHRQLTGPMGVVKSVVIGVPLPLCSCGVIPAGLGLKEDGASNGAAVGFLVATPQTGIDSMLVSASFLGWPFALSKVGAALVTGLAAGWVTDAVAPTPPAPAPVAGVAIARTWRDGLDHGIDMIRMIWGWLVFGVLLSAALSTWLPPDSFAGLLGGGTVLAFVAALGVSLPLYVCATASVPIAAALVAAGMPTGAAMVFLMAGPASNAATIGAVYRAFGAKILSVYLGSILVGSVAFGLAYERVFGALVTSATHNHEHTAWWAQGAAVVLVLLIAWFAIEEVQLMISRQKAASSTGSVLLVGVDGMTCGGCSGRLERLLNGEEGVEAATVSLDDKLATITGSVSRERVVEIVTNAGFDARDV